MTWGTRAVYTNTYGYMCQMAALPLLQGQGSSNGFQMQASVFQDTWDISTPNEHSAAEARMAPKSGKWLWKGEMFALPQNYHLAAQFFKFCLSGFFLFPPSQYWRLRPLCAFPLPASPQTQPHTRSSLLNLELPCGLVILPMNKLQFYSRKNYACYQNLMLSLKWVNRHLKRNKL